jgi:flagellar hook protein FlgE
MNSFSTALSALKGHEQAVDVVGNNLANLNTSGFKSSGLAFSDLVSQNMGSGKTQIGMGIGTPRTIREFTQGPIQPTGRPLDAAIQGSGFFVTQDTNGKTLYSRVGSFNLSGDGSLLTQSGASVLGWPAVAGKVDTTRTAGPLSVSVGTLLQPHTTTALSMNVNLNSQTDAASTANSFTAPVNVVDSLGVSHVLSVTFTKDPATPLTWTYKASLPAADLKAAGSGVFFGAAGTAASGTMTFDSKGNLITAAPAAASDTITIKGLSDEADPLKITWNFLDPNKNSMITQLSAESSQSGIVQDGYQASELTGLSIANGGAIIAEYSNGLQQIAGQLALASIRNPETLLAVGDNSFQATAETAGAAIGMASTGGRGQIVGGSIEGSNVDIAREFTNLIVYQRGYQANAKVITAADDLSQQTINLIR